MFDQGWKRPEREEEGKEEIKKPAPRFSPRVIAAQLGRPIPEYTSDRKFSDGLFEPSKNIVPGGGGKQKRAPRPKPEQKPKKEPTPKPEKQQPMQQPAVQSQEGIQSTTDYARFKFLPSNRPVDGAHVQRLRRAIRKKNLLHLNPIVVNTDNGIIEGQHRLEAAKQENVPIYFIQNDAVTQDDIAGMNSNKKNWALVDYIHFHQAKGVPAYVEFLKFYGERGASLPIAIVLTIATEKGSLKSSYKDGTLDISNLKLAGEVISYLSDFKPFTQFYNSAKCIEALAYIVRTGLYDHGHMMAKLEVNPGALQPQAQMKGWIVEMQRAYNWKSRDEKLVTFLKRL